ncbi:tumor necrosis factor receptor superfamily member 6B-like isoform X2 [Micropterus dolomieu]|uniref:tumor necrosis factor receptor superfamily member 6B-like isoform X2 n=1 Tax=Micropterus dolomieu TaxID=147949 RepID=UPI001E8E54B0|nr:tumor necrosis factor receptor superfamily member 6B-like isoform X2 [Micropterus dolomieu]
MMLLSLFPVVLLSVSAVLVDGVASQLRTFRDTDRTTGMTVVCDKCPPGTFMKARCTSTHKSECAPCPQGSFTELWNYIGKCLRCGACGQNQVEKTACSAERDCQCECKKGYYYKKNYDMCFLHSECPPGQGVLTQGTADEDTVCHTCPNGSYSDTVSAHQNCTEHTICKDAGLELVLKGSIWHNSVCTSNEELKSRNGGDYLKEILPTFFVHQKMSLRRLRQILHRLPSEDRKKQGGTSGLNYSQLNVRINTWVTSATGKQIQQLPEILNQTGAISAGEKLQKKLRRINSRLSELCSLGNALFKIHCYFHQVLVLSIS